jgi:hypothetical protein
MKYTTAELQDRGNIKWTAMMLPEHKLELISMQESQKDIDPPDHDLDRLCEIAELLARAMQDSLVVNVRYWRDKRHVDVTGMVKRIDPLVKAILISVDEYDSRWVEAKHIFEVDVIICACILNGVNIR